MVVEQREQGHEPLVRREETWPTIGRQLTAKSALERRRKRQEMTDHPTMPASPPQLIMPWISSMATRTWPHEDLNASTWSRASEL